MKIPPPKAIGLAFLLVVIFFLHQVGWTFIALSLAPAAGRNEFLMFSLGTLTVVIVVGTLAFTHFVLGLLPIKRKPVVMWTLLIFIPWFYMFMEFNLDPPHYGTCEIYTKKMNGGIHAFRGTPYNIELCGLDGRIDPAHQDDEVQLRIFSMDGELLVERYFEPLIGMGDFGLQLRFGDDRLEYDCRNEGPTRRIEMPPSKWEWIRARLPRPWPFH